MKTAHTLLAQEVCVLCAVPCYPQTSTLSCRCGNSSTQQGTDHEVSPFFLLPRPGSSHLHFFLPFILPALQGCSLPTSTCTMRDFPFLSPTNPMGKLSAHRKKGSSLCMTFLDFDIWPGPALRSPDPAGKLLSCPGPSPGPCAACSWEVARAAWSQWL